MPGNPRSAQEEAEKRVTEAAKGSSQLPPAALRLHWLGEFTQPKPLRWVVKGVLLADTAAVIYGEPNAGKSFFTMDLALHVAAGQPWRGKRTTRGLVVYVATEGGQGIANRLCAYVRECTWLRGAPFALITDRVNLLADHLALVAAVQEAEATAGDTAALVVLDTIARVMPGGDENSGQDIGRLIDAIDAVRKATGATVIGVHHPGKNTTAGMRGHSSLHGALDTEIQVEGTKGRRTATVRKQRDGRTDEVFAFELVPVVLGQDDDGDDITTCVVATCDPPPPTTQQPTGKVQKAVLEAMAQQAKAGKPIVSTGDLVRLLKDQHPKSSVQSAVQALTQTEPPLLQLCTGGVRLPDDDL